MSLSRIFWHSSTVLGIVMVALSSSNMGSPARDRTHPASSSRSSVSSAGRRSDSVSSLSPRSAPASATWIWRSPPLRRRRAQTSRGHQDFNGARRRNDRSRATLLLRQPAGAHRHHLSGGASRLYGINVRRLLKPPSPIERSDRAEAVVGGGPISSWRRARLHLRHRVGRRPPDRITNPVQPSVLHGRVFIL